MRVSYSKLTVSFLCCALCLATIFCGNCPAQSISARVIDLPGSFDRDLLQVSRDDEGFIWFATNQGLWRFDGTDVKLLDYKKLKLPQNTAPYLLYCYHQYIFFCTLLGEVHVYNKATGQCDVYNLQTWVSNINLLPSGDLLFFTQKGVAYRFTPGGELKNTFKLPDYTGWQTTMELQKSIVDSSGQVYIVLRDRIGLLQKNSIKWGPALALPTEKSKNPFAFVYTTATTSRYIAAQYYNGELVIYNKQTLLPLYVYKGDGFAWCLAVNDSLVTIPRAGTKKVDYAASPVFKVLQGLLPDVSKVTSAVFTNNSFLLGTNAGLAELALGPANNTYISRLAKTAAFFRNKSIRSIYRAGDSLYVGTYSGFFVCAGDSIHKVADMVVYSIKRLDAGALLLAIEGYPGFELFNLHTGQYTNLPGVPGMDIYVTSLYHDDDDGGHWVAGDYTGSLFTLRQNPGAWGVVKTLADTACGLIRQTKSIGGSFYIAAQNGFYKAEGESKPQKIYPPGNESVRVYCMQETEDGIWIGTHGNGLVKIGYNDKVLQQVGFNNGLAGDFVYSLAKIDNLLVAGTSNGVSVFNIANGTQPLPVQKPDSILGISTEECNHSAIFNDTAHQQVILGGVNGLVFVNGSYYGGNGTEKSMGITLSYVKTGGYQTAASQADLFAGQSTGITITPNEPSVTLKFACPGNVAQTEGLFRILGLDDKWQRINLGQEINLYALPPGGYTLQARLPSAINSSQWFSKQFVVEPAFYQTNLFKAALGLLLLGVIYFLWRLQVRRIEKENRLRATIAGDLHDDIGSTLNSISVYTEILGRQLHAADPKTNDLLSKMGTASRGMIDTMSDIVWTINPKNDDFDNVLKRMQFFAAELLSAKNILLHFELDERVKKLKFTMQERKNIYLIYKEAINNIFKYSDATSVTISIAKDGGHLTLSITDNGKGFDTQEKRNTGNGLGNMKNRAKEINAFFSLHSTPEQGTRVSFRLRIP